MKDTITVNGETYQKVEQKPVTVVYFLLDMSGSMTSTKKATISGFNEYLHGLKTDGNNYRINVTFFDDKIEKPYVDADIFKVNPIRKEYEPRGMTALYDAVCKTLDESRKLRDNEKALVVIMTDGGENASREYKQEDFVKIKSDLEKSEKWTFVFLGANQDAWATAKQWGFAAQNVASYNATAKGSEAAFRGMSASTTDFAGSGNMTTQSFMAQEVKNDIEETK